MKKGTVKAKLMATPANSKGKKVYAVCVEWPGGNSIDCGTVMATSEAEAKKLGKAAAKKATASL